MMRRLSARGSLSAFAMLMGARRKLMMVVNILKGVRSTSTKLNPVVVVSTVLVLTLLGTTIPAVSLRRTWLPSVLMKLDMAVLATLVSIAPSGNDGPAMMRNPFMTNTRTTMLWRSPMLESSPSDE